MRSRNSDLGLLLLAALAVAGAWAQEGGYQSPPEELPRAVGPQPVAFSHKIHAARNLECADCHKTAETRITAGLPQAQDCMVCHGMIATDHPEVVKLAELAKAGEEIEWVRVYDSPDFVFFSHKNHLTAGEECASCHGDVTQFDALPQEVSISMTACMNCHAERGAENECYLCHELGQ